MEGMNVLDLFSGIGGFSLGLERAGMRTVAFCEIEPYCRAVLRKHWPDVPIFEDVRTLRAGDIREPIDVICGGFPCQPYSHAGKQLGSEDNRALWPEYRRIVEEFRPSWVIGENVVGIVDLALDNVLANLEALGYETRAFDIPACAVGARHERRRIWIVANATSDRLQGKLRQDRVNEDWTSEALASSSFSRWKEQLPEPYSIRSLAGVPGAAHRIKALGNAVVPQIPEIIGRAIMQAEGLK